MRGSCNFTHTIRSANLLAIEGGETGDLGIQSFVGDVGKNEIPDSDRVLNCIVHTQTLA